MNIKLQLLLLVLMPFAPLKAQFASAPAFPGAEGYGRYTTGGRGGKVYHVTTLEDYCTDPRFSKEHKTEEPIKGSLRYALRKNEVRTIVFDVDGTIELKCPLRITKPNVSVLGQTAPGDGICLKNYTLQIDAGNVIVRFIRCRMGDEGMVYFNKKGEPSVEHFENDAMNACSMWKSNNNIIIDHCSMSWSTDECGSFYGNRFFTLQWCILSESLRNSSHKKGRHGFGGIWGGDCASFHHNLIAHHDSRNPRFDHGFVSTLAGPVDCVNNVVYNWGGMSAYGGENRKGFGIKTFNMINNYYKPGTFTRDSTRHSGIMLSPTTQCSNCNHQDANDIVPGRFYLSGNMIDGAVAKVDGNLVRPDKNCTFGEFASKYMIKKRLVSDTLDFRKFNFITLYSASVALDRVAATAGASKSRDAVDARVCGDVLNGTVSGYGHKYHTPGLIDSQNDVGGWPVLKHGASQPDSDGDGIPDEWERRNGLKVGEDNSKTYTLDKKRFYTDLEVYANSIVEHIVKSERAGTKTTFKEYFPESK